jgi:threonine/homoserine/homoserine lactone efflux protein
VLGVCLVVVDEWMHRRKEARRRTSWNFTLRGLPELDSFPTAEARQAALDEIGSEAGNPKSVHFWLGVLATVAGALAARWLAGWLLSFVLWVMEEILHAVGMLAGFLLMLRWLHRRGTARDLRMKLLASGVPVCLSCGYLLRGLSAATARCPECGTAFSSGVCELLSTVSLEKGMP